QNITSPDASVAINQVGNDFELTVTGGGTDNQDIQGSALTNEILTIAIENGNSEDVNLAPFALETEVTAAIAASDAADGDTDDTNELQNITSPDASVAINQVGNDFELTVTGGGTNLSTTNLTQTGGNRTYNLNAQELYFTGTGFIGIGNTNPQNKLDVSGEIRSQGFSNSNGTVSEPSYAFSNDTDTGMWRGFNANFLRFSTSGSEAITIDPSQQVGIGITVPTEILHVGGNILATGTITPDFVFETYFDGKSISKPDYKMLSLSDIENFTRINKHLPGVPSAKEVAIKGGIVINRATEINLEKIEELFLHTINQEKEINQLKTKNESLSTELELVRKDLAEIKELLINMRKD
ncbi:MAG: hypothetical protein WBN69_10055, partial [Eudoraea sp.]